MAPVRGIAEKYPQGDTRQWAEELLDRTRRLFWAWHCPDEMMAEDSNRSMVTQRNRFIELVCKPPLTHEAANLAARFEFVECTDDETGKLRASDEPFRFMYVEGVEPINTLNEQELLHSVVDRRITQGTLGASSLRHRERMWTAIATGKKQGRNFLSFLQSSITCQIKNKPTPLLLYEQ